ncbi:MAG: hypothetical protein LBU48_05645 [Coriobacteriales bacterium]|jgi:hypothetical protein|nr:hypothetical protein [Coriobacteriales bacterium]
MGGFRFASASSVEVEIEGKVYSVNWGDPSIQQRVLDFSLQLMGTKLSDIDGEMLPWISEQIHSYIAELLGEQAEAEVFADRSPNLMEELRLFTYIQEQISKNKQLAELEAALGRYAVGATK